MSVLDPQDLPRPYLVRRVRCQLRLPLDLMEQVEYLRKTYRHIHPEICVRKSRFVETALRYFVRNFETLTATKDVECV